VKKNNQSGFGIRSETGEIYMLTKKERILTIEILRLTLATAAGREFVVERFGKDGLKTAIGLLEEMGVQIGRQQEEREKPAS
jgi:dihydrodipicolinate synthase/N-acetylneuraminate lyase